MLGGVDRAMRSTDTVTRDALSCQKVGGGGGVAIEVKGCRASTVGSWRKCAREGKKAKRNHWT